MKIYKLLIVSIFPLVAAGCCSDDNWLRRIEVWKQQELFGPKYPPVMAPACCPQAAPCAPVNPCAVEPTCGMSAPAAVEPTCGMSAPVAVEPGCEMQAPVAVDQGPMLQTVGSPEVVNGVLEQQ